MRMELWGLRHAAWQGQPLLSTSYRHVGKEIQWECTLFFSPRRNQQFIFLNAKSPEF